MTRISTSIIESFSFIGKALSIVFVCTIIGCVIVFPLWYAAITFPTAYSSAVLMLLFAFTAYKIILAIKKSSWQRMLLVLLRTAIVVGGTALAVAFVFAGFRFAAIPIIILIPLLHIACSRLFKNA